MELEQIVSAWLRSHNYDGLFHEDGECGCRLGDLMPCSSPGMGCEPGYLSKNNSEELCDWCIQREKPAPPKPPDGPFKPIPLRREDELIKMHPDKEKCVECFNHRILKQTCKHCDGTGVEPKDKEASQ